MKINPCKVCGLVPKPKFTGPKESIGVQGHYKFHCGCDPEETQRYYMFVNHSKREAIDGWNKENPI